MTAGAYAETPTGLTAGAGFAIPITRAASTVVADLYLRVSSDRQEDEGTSLETQEERARRHATERGYSVRRVYRETKSGYRLYERPELMRLKAGLGTPDSPDVVIFYDPDRFSRNQSHIGMVLDWFESAGVRLEFVTCEFEGSAVGKFILQARVFAAELEREKIIERTMRGRVKKVEEGRAWVGARPPYGFRWTHRLVQRVRNGQVVQVPIKERYEEDPETAWVVRRIFREVAAGGSLRGIARGLTDDGVPTVLGGEHWSPSTIAYLLGQRCYLGEVESFKHARREARRDGRRVERWVLKPDDDPTRVRAPEGFAPALVDRKTWEAAQERLRWGREHHGRRTTYPEAALLRGGRAKCGGCGGTLGVRIKGTRAGPQYFCVRALKWKDCPAAAIVSVRILDGAVWEGAYARLTRPEVVGRELARLAAEDPTAGDLESIERQLADVRRRQATLAKLAATVDDEDAAAPLLAELGSLADRKRALAEELQYVLDRRAGWEAARGRLGDIAAQYRKVAKNAGKLDFAGRRLAVEALDITATAWKQGAAPLRYEVRTGILPDGWNSSGTSRTPG
jgi:site-specific DNA recombinase